MVVLTCVNVCLDLHEVYVSVIRMRPYRNSGRLFFRNPVARHKSDTTLVFNTGEVFSITGEKMPKASDYLFEEVKLIQGVINRMANNSFLIKGWAITLVVATFLFRGSSNYYFVAFLPWLLFWYLDGFFLRQERLYRNLYDWVVMNRKKSKEYLLDLSCAEMRFGGQVDSIPRIMFSKTLLAFYGLLLLLIIIAILVNFFFPQSLSGI